MSSITQTAPRAEAAERPPVRHGKARLLVRINGRLYLCERCKQVLPGMRSWLLSYTTARGVFKCYCVSRSRGTVSCTCPDDCVNGAACKHARALQALGVVSSRRCSAVKGGV